MTPPSITRGEEPWRLSVLESSFAPGMWRFDATLPPLMMISASKTDAMDESEREPQNSPRWLMRSRLTAYQGSRQFSRPQLITERSLYCGAKSSQEWNRSVNNCGLENCLDPWYAVN